MWSSGLRKVPPTVPAKPLTLNAAMTYLEEAVTAAACSLALDGQAEPDLLETARALDSLRGNTIAVDRITRLAVDCFYGDVSVSMCSAMMARDFEDNNLQLQVLRHRRGGRSKQTA